MLRQGCITYAVFCVVHLALIFIVATPASAQTYTLTDGNARMEINPLQANSTQAFTVDGEPNRVVNSGFWWSGGSGNAPEQPLSDIRFPAPILHQSAPNVLSASYGGLGLRIGVEYTLCGGVAGSGEASLIEDVTVFYHSFGPLFIILFEYNHFELDAAIPQDQAAMLNPYTFVQQGSKGRLTVTTDLQATYQIDDPAFLLESLFDNQPTMLNNTPGLGKPFPPLPGEVAFAYRWRMGWAQPAFERFRITKTLGRNTQPIPETGSLTLLAAAFLPSDGLLACSPRKRGR